MACWTHLVQPFTSPLFLPLRYLGSLRWPKVILWCYLCWYAGMVSRHFDPAPRLWLSSLGISGLIGLALIFSTATAGSPLDGWTRFRLFLMPFCVSSYSALIKDQGFILLFSPSWADNLLCLALCAAFVTTQRLIRAMAPTRTALNLPLERAKLNCCRVGAQRKRGRSLTTTPLLKMP
jgi:hypothetical protein